MFTKTDIEKYFAAEKTESLIFVIIGIAAIVLAIIFFFFLKTNFYKGMALPLLLIALIQITVGYSVYKRSDDDRKKNTYAYDLNPSDLKNKEIPRMEKVNKNFVVYRWIEISLILIGIALILKYKNDYIIENCWSGYAFTLGIAIGIVIQATLMLGADYFAEKRAKIYTNHIIEFVNKK